MSAKGRKRDVRRIRSMGTVIDALPGAIFRVRLDDDREVVAYVSARRSRLYSPILLGDRVRVELFPDEPEKGQIVRRRRRWQVREPMRSFLKRLLGSATRG